MLLGISVRRYIWFSSTKHSMLKHGALVKYHLATITHDLFYLHGWGLWMLMLKSILHMFYCFGSNSSECKSHWSYNSSPMKSIGLMRSKPWVKCYMISECLQCKAMMNPIGALFYFKCVPKSKPREKAVCTTYHMVRMSSLLLEWVPFITEWEWDANCVIFCFWNEQLAPVLSLLQSRCVEIKQELFC